jgi:hypothetical protein
MPQSHAVVADLRGKCGDDNKKNLELANLAPAKVTENGPRRSASYSVEGIERPPLELE